MSVSSDQQAASRPVGPTGTEFKRAWRMVTIAGALGTIWGTICLGSAPRTKFLIELGATPYHFGLMAAISSAALLLQLFSGIWANHLQRRKPPWMVLIIVHRLIFLGVLAAPLLFVNSNSLRMWWIIGVLLLHDSLMNIGSPLWFSWMADLVPPGSMGRSWGSRQRFTWTVNIAASILVAFVFYFFEKHHHVLFGFGVLGGAGVALGIIYILLFIRVPDVPNERDTESSLGATLLEPLRNSDFRRFTLFMCYWMFGIMISAPFMAPFQMEVLKMGAMTVQILLVLNYVGTVVSSRFWGLLCDTYGQRPVILISVVGKAFIPLAMLCAPPTSMAVSISLLAGGMFFDGVMGGGIMLALQSYLFKISPRRNRTIYISSCNFFQGIACGVAAFVAGAAIDALNQMQPLKIGYYSLNGYHAMFAISFVLRLGAWFFAIRLREPKSQTVKTMVSHLRGTNPLKVMRTVYVLSESENQSERLKACRRLAAMQSPLAIGELIQALEDPLQEIRTAAANALGHIGVSEASEPLARALTDGDLGIQSPAARALGQIGDYNSLKALLCNLNSMQPQALAETINSLGKIGDSAAILPLICLFDEVHDEALRHEIASALGRLSVTESADDVMAIMQASRQRPRQMNNLNY